MREMSDDEREKVVTADGAKSLLDLWPLFLFLTGVIAAWSLIIIATTRWILGRCLLSYDKKIDGGAEAARQLEKDFLEMKASLPIDYVRKEDFIRHEVVINTKLDRLRDLMEEILKEKRP